MDTLITLLKWILGLPQDSGDQDLGEGDTSGAIEMLTGGGVVQMPTSDEIQLSGGSAHFRDYEFKCRDGSPVPAEFLANLHDLQARYLEPIRDHFGGAPVSIVSGYRSPEYNRKIDGADKSQHMTANAADIQIKGFTAAEVAAAVRSMAERGIIPPGGIGEYTTFVHVDRRGTPARWKGDGVK